ncbi:MAG: protein kinase, partial [Candidatus Dadabacteria bacterium]|nr:serine/threonine protein kinase [Candidatus Dadabacteria bacterium]NIX15555.1 protein kinase [Candidatus Dadabacteria bacterium]NIY22295.1 protein kinase [Candidatus Dadabacteria bacterium]
MIGINVGEYRIVEKVGQGGMGSVYKAVHTTLEQIVAIKVLSSEFSDNPSMRSRFINEARIQAKFKHPNVVNVLNFFEIDEKAFLVMEFIEGETLEKILQRKGKLQIEEALDISYSVLNALVFMHSKGVIHRDVKPANIMFTRDNVVKVADFGIAKSVNEKTKHTKTGLLGSVMYLTPEQILGEQTSAATDVYSFGITLYKMLTGRTPFSNKTEFEIMKSHLEEDPTSPNEYNDYISKSLNKVILKSIAKDPKDRFSSASEFSQKLRSSKKENFRLDINMPDLAPIFDSFGLFIKRNMKKFII